MGVGYSHPDGWTEERIERLKKLWLDGRSASEIAAALKGGLTRNGVIGKVHRLGLAGREGAGGAKPVSSGKTAALQAKAAAITRAPKSARVSPNKKPADMKPATWNGGAAGVAPPPYKPAKVQGDREPLNLTLLDLPASGCKWPVNDGRPEFLFCGHRRFGDTPYCQGHGAGAYSAASSLAKHSAKELVRSVRRYL